jgi:hypothetical protein
MKKINRLIQLSSFIFHHSKKVSRRRLLPVSPTTDSCQTTGQSDCNSPNRNKPIRRKILTGCKSELRKRGFHFLLSMCLPSPEERTVRDKGTVRVIGPSEPSCPTRYNAIGTEGRRRREIRRSSRQIRSIFVAFLASLNPFQVFRPGQDTGEPHLFCLVHVAHVNPGKRRERHSRVNRQDFPKLWPFSHLGDPFSRFMR